MANLYTAHLGPAYQEPIKNRLQNVVAIPNGNHFNVNFCGKEKISADAISFHLGKRQK
jgi:hypothetical protein